MSLVALKPGGMTVRFTGEARRALDIFGRGGIACVRGTNAARVPHEFHQAPRPYPE
jgi:hypothetical protein